MYASVHFGVLYLPPHLTHPCPGLHPAHALQGRRTPQEAPTGAQGKRASLLHALLPRLGRFQNSPRIDTRTETLTDTSNVLAAM